jgi:hypothetical protein
MQCSLNDEIKKDQTGEAFSTLWRYVNEMQSFNKNVMDNDFWVTQAKVGRIILKWVSKLNL